MTLHDELQRIADRAPVADVPAHTWSRARRARRRDAVLSVGAAVAVIALVAGAVAWLPERAEPPVADGGSLGVPDELHEVPERMSDRTNDGTWVRDEVSSDVTSVGTGAAAWVTRQGLPVVVGAADGAYHLLDLPDFIGNSWIVAGSSTPSVALSPDGHELAYAYAVFGPGSDAEPIPSGVRVIDLTTGELREIPVSGEEGTAVTHIEWSPDGSWLAFAGMQQSYWTEKSMGTSSYLDNAGPVVGRVAPGSTQAEVKKVTNDDVPLSVDDRGTVQWRNGRIQVWGTSAADPEALEAVGLLPDGRWLQRTGTAGNDVLSVPRSDGRRHILIDVVGIDGSLSVATDLMTPPDLTVSRPAPDWPMSDERRALVMALSLLAVGAAVLALRWLLRRR